MIDLDFAKRHLKNVPDDDILNELLIAAESAVRAYTHNRFPHGLPPEVQLGIVRMAEWEFSKVREKQGIASETLSRHSITYAHPDEDQFIMGYPKSIMGFCKPYRRPRT